MEVTTVQAWLPSIVAAGALGLVWLDMRSTKQHIAARVEEIAAALKKSLYRDDGVTNFMPRAACEREQTRCQHTTCGKIDALSVKMDLMDTKREHAKDQTAVQLGDIRQELAELNGRVEELSKEVGEIRKSGGV